MSEHHVGKVVEVIGPVVVVAFESGHLPAIYNAVRDHFPRLRGSDPIDIIAEVEQHLGEGRVKCVSMQPTDGMVRGMNVEDLGRADHRAGGQGYAGARDERYRRAGG